MLQRVAQILFVSVCDAGVAQASLKTRPGISRYTADRVEPDVDEDVDLQVDQLLHQLAAAAPAVPDGDDLPRRRLPRCTTVHGRSIVCSFTKRVKNLTTSADDEFRVPQAKACDIARVSKQKLVQWFDKGYVDFASGECDRRRVVQLILADELSKAVKKKPLSLAMTSVAMQLPDLDLDGITSKAYLVWDSQTHTVRFASTADELAEVLRAGNLVRPMDVGQRLLAALQSFKVAAEDARRRLELKHRLHVIRGGADSQADPPEQSPDPARPGTE